MPLLRPLLLDPPLLLMMLPMMLLLLLPLLRSSCRHRPPASITPYTLAAIHPHAHPPVITAKDAAEHSCVTVRCSAAVGTHTEHELTTAVLCG
jgi:hypothetical protein